MKYWENFDVLHDKIERTFVRFIKAGHEETLGQVGSRCMVEYEMDANQGEAEKWIVYSTIGCLLIKYGEITRWHYDYINKAICSYDREKALQELSEEDVARLEEQIQRLKDARSMVKKGDSDARLLSEIRSKM